MYFRHDFSWDKYFERQRNHYFLKTLQKYKKTSYKKIFKKIFKKKVKNKIIWITDSYDIFYNLDLFSDLRYSNTIIDSDISKICIKKINKKYKLICDASKIPFKKESIDIVISPSTLDHFGTNFFVDSLVQIEKILKKNGIAIILLHNKYNIFLLFFILQFTEKEKYYTYTRKNILDVLKTTPKLKLEKIFYTMNLPFPLFLTSFINFLDRKKIKSRLIRKFIAKILRKSSEVSNYPYISELMCFLVKKI